MKKLLLILLLLPFINYAQEILKNETQTTKEKQYKDISFSVIEEVPVYKGCESSGDNNDKKNCMNKMLVKHIQKNFNTDIINCLEKKTVYNKQTKKKEQQCVSVLSPGKKRIYLQFKISKTGEVEDIKARAPHNKLKEEAKRVARLIPKMKPGKQRGKPIRVSYTLPITLNAK